MDDQQQSAERLQGAAAVACASCRRLKVGLLRRPPKQGVGDVMDELADGAAECCR